VENGSRMDAGCWREVPKDRKTKRPILKDNPEFLAGAFYLNRIAVKKDQREGSEVQDQDGFSGWKEVA